MDNSFKIPFFSESFPKNQSSKDRRNLDKQSKHISNNVCVQRWVYQRLKCSAEKVPVFLQYKMKIQNAKKDIKPRLRTKTQKIHDDKNDMSDESYMNDINDIND